MIEVSRQQSGDVGGCNSCDRYITSEGTLPHRVWVISGGGAGLRLCKDCLVQLILEIGRTTSEGLANL